MTSALGSIDRTRGAGAPAPARVVLLRRHCDERLLVRLRDLLTDPVCPTRVFLQGEGVELAQRGPLEPELAQRARWQVCVGSWRRRQAGDPPAPFELATLGGWLDVLLPDDEADPELVSFGRGDEG